MYGSLINGKLEAAPNPLVGEDCIIFNPTSSQHATAGYLPIINTPQPEQQDGGETVYYSEAWQEVNGQIVQTWVTVQAPGTPAPTPTLEQRVSAVEDAVMELAEVIAG